MAIFAELKGNRIHVRSSRNIRALQDVVPGANFSKSGGAHWSVPLTLSSVRLLRRKFKAELEIGPELDEWGRTKVRVDKALAELARQPSAQIGISLTGEVWENTYPGLAKALRGRAYQSVGARFIAAGRRVLVCDTVGLGKTAQALGGVMESGVPGPYLVIAPKTAGYSVWGREIERWLPGHVAAVVPESREKRDKFLNRAMVTPKRNVLWMIINPWMLHTKKYWQCNQCGVLTVATTKRKDLSCKHNKKKTKTIYEHEFPQLFEIEWGAIIIDESHKVLIKKSKVSTQTRAGIDLLNITQGGVKIAQSGTPFRSTPHLLFGTLSWLRKEEFTAYWPWVQTYWEVDRGFNNSMEIGDLKDEEGLGKSLRGIMLRRTREEVAPHLPRRQYIGTPHPKIPADKDRERGKGIWLPMSSKQEKIYEQMFRQSVAFVKDGDLDAIGSLAELTRLRQFANSYASVTDRGRWRPELPSNKLEYILNTLLPELNFDEKPMTKVVIVSQFTQILNLFAAEVERVYGPGMSCLFTGAVSGKKRPEVVDRFNIAGRPPYVMFLNSDAGGESITLDAADEMIFVDEKHDDDVQDQAEGRIDNRRPEEKIVQRRYRYLRSLGTVDEEIMLAAAARSFDSQRVLRDGERIAKEIFELL